MILTIILVLSTIFTIFLLILPSRFDPSEADKDGAPSMDNDGDDAGRKMERVHILVLGDIGRSPRMQYHAISLAKMGITVDLIGYKESKVHPDISSNALISIHPIPLPPKRLQTDNKILFLLCGPVKVLFQVWSLWLTLGYGVQPARWMIVQNPPSIPTLLVAQVMCFLRLTHLIIDWHNFGYSILALKLGETHPLVRFSKWYEKTICRFAILHFTVTKAMAKILERDFNLQFVLPLHDRPYSQFKPLKFTERLAFLARLPETAPHLQLLEKGKMKLLVSSTSWTPDEDFSVLLSALSKYSEMATSTHPGLPELLVIITGKGPLKDHYLEEVALLNKQRKLEMITLKTSWLSTADYASLLGAADLGLSLHTSSSGVDLPMKVVDMFGAGLPVVGWSFEAWQELVQDGVNGDSFENVEELLAALVDLLGGDEKKLQRLKEGALKESEKGWDDEWSNTAGKIFDRSLGI